LKSLRARILAIVIGAGLVPLALLGLWLARSAASAGEAVVRARMGASLDSVSRQTSDNWRALRYDLLFLAEDREVQHALIRHQAVAPASFDSMFGRLPVLVGSATVRDSAGAVLWRAARAAAVPRPESHVPVSVLIHSVDGSRIGSIDFAVHYTALLDAQHANHVFGGMYGLLDPASGQSYLPLPFAADRLRNATFEWGGETWIVEKRPLHDPPLQMFAVAPATPFITPMRAFARRGLLLFLIVAAAGAAAALVLTRQLTQSLEQLAVAANRVSRGSLDARVPADRGPSEVRHVAAAFNTMSSSLRSLLEKRSQRDALAAVGEFATELAHEVRNPLTAIRMDLELIEERLPPDSELRSIQSGAIEQIMRLDSTVTRALNVARSGASDSADVSVARCLDGAVRATMPRISERGAILRPAAVDDSMVRGDAAALQQLFSNLLRNAADACQPGDAITISARRNGPEVDVTISDAGVGMTEALLARAFEPMFSTKIDGTGVGLAIVRRVADAHGAHIQVNSEAGKGTSVRVTFPAVSTSPDIDSRP
jgi:signal transduction histidine kinase